MIIELITKPISDDYISSAVFTIDECTKILNNLDRTNLKDQSNIGFGDEHSNRLVKFDFIDYNIKSAWIYQRIIDAVITINADKFNFNLTNILEPITVLEHFCSKSYNPMMNLYNSGDIRMYGMPRKLICNILLTDNYDGGDFNIFGQKNIKIKIGDMIIFPSFINHQILPVRLGNRVSLSLSFFGPPFK